MAHVQLQSSVPQLGAAFSAWSAAAPVTHARGSLFAGFGDLPLLCHHPHGVGYRRLRIYSAQ